VATLYSDCLSTRSFLSSSGDVTCDESNWRPRPLRMLKCWSDLPGYAEFVGGKWDTFSCQGWGGFVLQQKLKMIKACLKEWHSQHVQNMDMFG